MLQIIKNRPNATTAVICVVVLAIVFMLSIVTAPAGYREAATGTQTLAAQPDDAVYKNAVKPSPDLLRDRLIDYSTIAP